ncbi:MAG: cell division protein FtsL [Rhabdaerophilum sp.]
MMRGLNILAIATLIGSATAAYSVKYETILVGEKLKKRESELQREKDAIAVLKAEWQMLNRPSRLAALAPLEAGMQTLSARQIVRASDIPARSAEKDPLAAALDGTLTGSIVPAQRYAPKAGGPTPVSPPRPATPARTTPVPRAAAVTPQPRSSTPAPRQTQPRPAQGAPLALRPPAPLGSTRGVTPRTEPSPAPIPRRNVSPPQR